MGVRVRRTAVTAGILGLCTSLLYAGAIPCVFAHVFHVPCPGCGSTRSAVALLHGDLDQALRFNPFGPVLALFLGVLSLQALASMFVHGDLRGAGEGRLGAVLKYGIFAVAGLEIALWVVRFFGVLGGPVPLSS